MDYFGTHIFADLYGCNATKLDNLNYIQESLKNAAIISGATCVDEKFHKFSPQGVTGVIVLQESHISIHTWPEYKYASIDFFSCGGKVDGQKGIDYLIQNIEAKMCQTKIEYRGDKQLALNIINKQLEANKHGECKEP